MTKTKTRVSNTDTPAPAKVTAKLSNRGEKLSIAPRVRARVVCHTEHTHTGINNTSFSDHARVRARAIPDEFIAAWRERIFAELGEDPVKVAVSEAIKDFGQKKDFTLWAWYANRIGVNNFLELYFEQKSIMRTSNLRNPAAAFHMRLKRFYAAMTEKEVAK
jgi:hypothetical protein